MGSESFTAKQGDWGGEDQPKGKNEKLLRRIHDRYKYMNDAWKDIKDQAEKDQRAVSITGPWTDEDREERVNISKRPCIHLDQLSQYTHALVNQVRSEPIAVKVVPGGDGANDQTAELRAKRIRAIEYETNAAQAYQTAFEHAVQNSFGAVGVVIEYKDWQSRQRAIKVRRIPNMWAWLCDPDCKEVDWADMRDFFMLDRLTKDEHERQYPDASPTASFDTKDINLSDWYDDDSVQIAEYWYTEEIPKKVYWVEMDGQEQRFFDDQVEGWKVDKKNNLVYLPDGSTLPLIDYRETKEPKIFMVKTNGIEILEGPTPWPGKTLPFAIVCGPERYIRSGNKVKKQLDSYIRMARDGQMLFDYYVSAEAEAISKVPKVLMLGYKGQFKESYWKDIHKISRTTAEIEPMRDEISGELLPLPQFITYEPPVQAIEIGKESARRSIQAAVASYGFTRLDDTNIKSGKAMDKLEQQRDLGSYHFIDSYKCMIKRVGRIINDLLDDVEGGENIDVSLRDMKEDQEVVRLGSQGPDGKPIAYKLTDEAQHEVTLTTGPTFQSQQEEARMFGDTMIANMNGLGIPPAIGMKVLAMLIKLKQMGPIGDQMAEILDPNISKGVKPEQLMAEIQKWTQLAEALGQQVQQLQMEKMTERQKLESQEKIAALNADVERFKAILQANTKNDEMGSKENIEDHKGKLAMQQAELKARIDSVAAEKTGAE